MTETSLAVLLLNPRKQRKEPVCNLDLLFNCTTSMDRPSSDGVNTQQIVKQDEGMSTLKEWAQLVCTSDIEASPVPIVREQFTIGRSLGCDLSLPENKLISGQHCVLTRNNDGSVVLRDTSTNGTLINPSINKVKVTKEMVYKLQHGDEIFLVYKKENHSQNVAYMFQDLSQLLDETLVNEDQESDEENTQEYELEKKESDARPAGIATKRPVSSLDCVHVEAMQAKRQRVDTVPDQCTHPEPSPRSLQAVTTVAHLDVQAAKEEAADPPGDGIATTALAAAVDSPEGVNAPESGKATTSVIAAVDCPVGGDTETTAGEGIANNLICSICQDIFHDCISLQPCLHSFCGACYSSWMDVSKECPSCRIDVQRLSRNFIVNSLVEAFLKEHPNRKRSDEELADMNAKNKITRDMMVPPKKTRNVYQYGSPSDEDEDDEDEDDESESYDTTSNQNLFGQHVQCGQYLNIGSHFAGRHRGVFVVNRPASICMQCPGYTGPGFDAGITLNPPRTTVAQNVNSKPSTATAASQLPVCTANAAQVKTSTVATINSASDQPSTSAGCSNTPVPPSVNCRGYKMSNTTEAIPMPVVPQHVCTSGANHLMCGCCRRQMPDRRQDYYANPQTIPAQKCDVCGNFFCHLYWGCNKLDCNGCLNKFTDLHFGKKCLDSLILKNSYESEILKDYLKRKNLTWKDVLTSCMSKLDSGEYICQDGAINRISSVNVLCYHCGLRNFQELAFQYRKDIPRNDLPPQIVARPDCHWGKKCRTQMNKAHHAKNFNHICEQTRF